MGKVEVAANKSGFALAGCEYGTGGTLPGRAAPDFNSLNRLRVPNFTEIDLRNLFPQYVLLQKYQGQINPSKNPLAKLLNKVNPVGGRFDLKSPQGRKIFREKALEIAKKYNLPIEFDPPNF